MQKKKKKQLLEYCEIHSKHLVVVKIFSRPGGGFAKFLFFKLMCICKLYNTNEKKKKKTSIINRFV